MNIIIKIIPKSKLGLRVFTGVSLVLFAISIIYLGEFYLSISVSFLGFFMIKELLRLTKDDQIGLISFLLPILAPFYLFFLFCSSLITTFSFELLTFLYLLVTFFLCLISIRKILSSTAVIYILGSLCAFKLALLSNFLSENYLFVYFFVSLVIATDTAGYIFGNLIGGPRPFKKISPNKTLSGYFSGAILSLILGLYWPYDFGISKTSVVLGSLAICLSVQIGDLLESSLKRKLNIKDSGNFFPGHGGFLDRFDGFIASVFTLYVLSFLYG